MYIPKFLTKFPKWVVPFLWVELGCIIVLCLIGAIANNSNFTPNDYGKVCMWCAFISICLVLFIMLYNVIKSILK